MHRNTPLSGSQAVTKVYSGTFFGVFPSLSHLWYEKEGERYSLQLCIAFYRFIR